MAQIKVGVIGLGFIGPAHIEGLRRTGMVDVAAFVETNAEVASRARSTLGIDRWYADYKEMLAQKDIVSIHICTPNAYHFQMAKESLMAGKHVVCEKPLATTVAEAREIVALAEKMKRCNAVNFNVRYYPLMRHAKAVIEEGGIGRIFSIQGSYLQDWLFYDTDYNWRLESSQSGRSRAVADIGSHWMDLVEHISGLKITAVFADFATFHKTRKKPSKPVATYSGMMLKPADYIDVPIGTEDYATLVFEFSTGTKGVLTVSQVAAGRKNRIYFEIGGSKRALAWNSERPNEIWIGSRDGANETLLKDPSIVHPDARGLISYPGGHTEGFPDTFKQMCREFYADVQDGTAAGNYATFKDGLREIELCEKIIESNEKRSWVKL